MVALAMLCYFLGSRATKPLIMGLSMVLSTYPYGRFIIGIQYSRQLQIPVTPRSKFLGLQPFRTAYGIPTLDYQLASVTVLTMNCSPRNLDRGFSLKALQEQSL